eukprot:1387818-Pyramimonas_sp.AAC.1
MPGRSDPAQNVRPRPLRVVNEHRDGRFFVIFGLQGPLLGRGTVTKRFRIKDWSWGRGRDLWGSTL